MTIQQIRCFVTVASCGSINKAASLLYMAQPNLSTTLRALEEELGYQLLVRNRSGVELTGEGLIFLSKAREVLLQFDELSLLDNLKEQPLALSVASMIHCHVIEALARLKKETHNFPYRVNFRTGVREDTVENVVNGNYNIGILYLYDAFKPQTISYLAAKQLSVIPLAPCHAEILVGTASPYYDPQIQAIEPDQLKHHTYVTYTAKEYVPIVRVSQLTHLDQYDSAIRVTDFSDLNYILNTLPSYSVVPVRDSDNECPPTGQLKLKNTFIPGEFIAIVRRDEVLTPVEEQLLKILREVLA